MGMLIANLQVLYQFRFLWLVGEGGVPWVRVGLVLGSVCLANLAVYLLGVGSAVGRLGAVVGAVLVSVLVSLFGAILVAMVGGCVRLLLGVWEVGRCLF